MSVVLFIGNSPLLLRNVERDSDGRITAGHVVNGAWRYERLGNTACAKDANGFVVNQWEQTVEMEREVPVAEHYGRDYAVTIEQAKRELKK